MKHYAWDISAALLLDEPASVALTVLAQEVMDTKLSRFGVNNKLGNYASVLDTSLKKCPHPEWFSIIDRFVTLREKEAAKRNLSVKDVISELERRNKSRVGNASARLKEIPEPHAQFPQFRRSDLESIQELEEKDGAFGAAVPIQTGEFDPEEIIDARKRILRSIVRRQGQPNFRRCLLLAYNGRCAITGCHVEAVLDAAHIIPYKGPETDHAGNGLLLRADFHTLFDLGLIAVEAETMSLLLSDMLAGTCYEEYRGRPIRMPDDPTMRPDRRALDKHCQASGLGRKSG